jgi:hypothetical protein
VTGALGNRGKVASDCIILDQTHVRGLKFPRGGSGSKKSVQGNKFEDNL